MCHISRASHFQLLLEKRIVFKESANYAIFGNGPESPFPIVNMQDGPDQGKEMPIYDKAWLARFAQEHAEQFRRMMEEWVPRLKDYTSGQLRELEGLPSLTPEILATAIKNVRTKIVADIAHWPFLEKFTPDHRADALKEYARQADELIYQLIHEWMPQLTDKISLSNEVKGTNDPAELLIMAFNRGLSPRVRFEARRKFLLMKMLGEMVHNDELRQHHDMAMSRMNQWLANEMYIEPTPGGRSGDQHEQYLVSEHDTVINERKTIKAWITPETPKMLGPNQRFTPLGMRRVRLKTTSGVQREVDCMIDVRDRRTSTRIIKKMQRDEPVETLDHDFNGLRLVFQTTQDLNEFLQTLKVKIHSDIALILVNRLRHDEETVRRAAMERLQAMENNVQIKIVSDNLNNVDPAKLKMMVIQLTVTDEDGKTYIYELQVFLPDGYADYQYRKGITREEHQADRFFDGPSELMFPPAIFPTLNHHILHQIACKAACAKAWNKGATEIIAP